jgi:hypothetical protein
MPTPLPVLPGVYYGHLTATYLGLPTGNIFTWKADAPPASSSLDSTWAQAIATSMADQWNLQMSALLPAGVHGWTAKVYPLGHPTLPAAEATSTGTGGASGTVGPVSCAYVIRNRVLRRGRGSQSHSLISPVLDNFLTSDGISVTGAAQTSLTNAYQAFVAAVEADFAAAITGHEIVHVQLSKKGAGTTYDIIGSECEALLGTARARTPRP